jgi:hypothetical protein
MTGLPSQSKRKREKRSVDMDMSGDGAVQPWSCPPKEECDEIRYQLAPPDGHESENVIHIRLVFEVLTGLLVEFALIQMTKYRGRWVEVFKIDSCHDDEVHAHRYGRTQGEHRVTERLHTVADVTDIQKGHDAAYPLVVDAWSENRRRWQDA